MPHTSRPFTAFKVALFGALAISLASCSALGGLGDALRPYTPKLSFKNMALRSIDFSKVDVDFIFALDNPNPVSVKLATFGYALGLEGVEILKGTQADGLKLEARGQSELAIPVSLTFARIFDLVKVAGQRDTLGYNISGELGFNTPVGIAKVPFRQQGDFPVVKAPDISVRDLKVGEFNPLGGRARLDLVLGFANSGGGSPVGFDNMRYAVNLMGRPVVESVLASVPDVAAGATREVTLPIALNLLTAGTAIVDAVSRKQAIDLGFTGVIDVRTPFGVIPLDIREVGNFLLK